MVRPLQTALEFLKGLSPYSIDTSHLQVYFKLRHIGLHTCLAWWLLRCSLQGMGM